MYRLMLKGTDKQTLSLAGLSLPANKFTFLEKLPLPLSELKKIPNLLVEKVVDTLPTTKVEVEKQEAKVLCRVGIVWRGTCPVRVTELGRFSKDVPRWDLTSEQVEVLSKKTGFMKVEP